MPCRLYEPGGWRPGDREATVGTHSPGRLPLSSWQSWGEGRRLGKDECMAPGCCGPVWARGLCTKHLKQWQRGRYQNPDPWLLPDDGIIDDIAVDVAVKGLRPVRLTQRERELAGAGILALGGSEDALRANLSLPTVRHARELAELIGSSQTAGGRLAA